MRNGQSVATRKLFRIALNCLLMIRAIEFDNSFIISRAQRNLGIGASVFGTPTLPKYFQTVVWFADGHGRLIQPRR